MSYTRALHGPSPSQRPSVRRILRIAGRLAVGIRTDLTGLSYEDLRDVWRALALEVILRRERDELEPEPDAPRLTHAEAVAALETLRVPTGGQVIQDILEEPVLQAALALMAAATLALTATPGGYGR